MYITFEEIDLSSFSKCPLADIVEIERSKPKKEKQEYRNKLHSRIIRVELIYFRSPSIYVVRETHVSREVQRKSK